MAPKLPGYHYDAEKGKYFKIILDCASTTGSKYSKTAVKKTEHQKHVSQLSRPKNAASESDLGDQEARRSWETTKGASNPAF